MPGEWTQVPVFGGGLDFSKNPAALDPSQWGWCENMMVQEASAVTSPTYEPMVPADYAFPGTTGAQNVIGVVANPFDSMHPLILVTIPLGATFPAPVRLWTCALVVPDAPAPGLTIAEITWSSAGGGAALTRYDVHSAVGSCFLNGSLIITVGAGPAGFSMANWTGGFTYTTLTGGLTTLRAAHIESFAGHVVAAGLDFTQAGCRTIRISDAEDPTVWVAGIANSADRAVLDDSTSGITGLALAEANTLAIFTRAGAWGISPTGNIPAFTRTYLGRQPAQDGAHISTSTSGISVTESVTPFCGTTPYGIAYQTEENLYVGFNTPVGTPVAKAFGAAAAVVSARLVWHDRWRILYVPGEQSYFTFNPTGPGWGREAVPGHEGPGGDHQMILYGLVGSDVSQVTWKRVFVADGVVYLEREFSPAGDTRVAFVDTKDFALPLGHYVDRMRVDWESVDGTALTVTAVTREELDPQREFDVGPTPNAGYSYDLSDVFAEMPDTHRFTLAAGQAEGPLRARGKWVRFRFSHTGGQVRIRGFAFRMMEASDRATSPDPTIPIFPGEWDAAGWDISSWAGPDGWEP